MLQKRAARQAKVAEIARIHGEILAVTVPLVDNDYFDLVIEAEVVAEIGGSAVTELFDSGVSGVMAVLRSEAQVNLLDGILRDAAQANDASRLQPLRERFTAAKATLLESLTKISTGERSEEHTSELQ